jgi:hypothetical protein
VLPFFVNQEKNGAQPGDLDVLVGLTNATDSTLSVELILRGADGDALPGGVHILTLAPRAALLVTLSSLPD